MGFKEFGRGLGEWFGVPAKETPHKTTIDREQKKIVETPNIAKKTGEDFKTFYLRAKEQYKEDGKRFNYADALLKGLRDQKKQELVSEYGEGKVGKMKRHLQETDSGIAFQMGKYAAIGASMVFAACYLQGDAAFIGSTALAAGGAMLYGREMIRGILSFGEKRKRLEAYGATKALKTELRSIPKEERFAVSRDKLRELKKLYDAMVEKKDQHKKRKMRDALIRFGLPKIAVASMIAFGMPVPLGAHDLDTLKIPDMKEAHLLLTKGLTGDISFMVDTMKGIGSKIGGPFWEQSEIGRKLAIGSTAYGTLAGFFGGTITRTNFEIAKLGIAGLEKIFQRPPTSRDIDDMKIKTVSQATRKARIKKQSITGIPQPQSPAPQDIAQAIIDRSMKRAKTKTPSRPRSEEDIPDFKTVLDHAVQEGKDWGKQTSPQTQEFIDTLNRRVQEKEEMEAALDRWDTESPAFPKEPANRAVAELTGLPSSPFAPSAFPVRKPVLQIPEAVGKYAPIEPAPISWRAKPETVRATILANFGIPLEDGKGVAYQKFKDQLKSFVSTADRDRLEELQKFLTTHDRQLNGTKGQKAVMMWTDRIQVGKLIESRLHELPLVIPPTVEPEVPSVTQEPAYTLEDLLAEAEAKEQEKQDETKRVLEKGAHNMLVALLKRQINPDILKQVREGKKSPHSDEKFVGKNLLQQIDSIDTWDRPKVADRLLKEIHFLVSGTDKREKILDPRDVRSYQKILREMDIEKKGSMIQRGLVMVRSDDEDGWIYRGSVMAPLDPKGVTLRARLNIILDEDSIKALDSLAARSAFFYRIGKPGSQNDPARTNATVTVYFPGDKPRRNVLEKLGVIAQAHRRGRGENLTGSKYNNHFYLSEAFTDRLPKEQEDRLMQVLQNVDQELFGVVKDFLKGRGGISEAEFHAIKKTLYAFGFRLEYHKEKGIAFLRPSKKELAA